MSCCLWWPNPRKDTPKRFTARVKRYCQKGYIIKTVTVVINEKHVKDYQTVHNPAIRKLLQPVQSVSICLEKQ